VGSLAEACTIIRRLWAEGEPFDFDGAYYRLRAATTDPARTAAVTSYI
jgi:alkanesulfonate monooxygenase SsuD/methylene tetrahydromethanopterin reductase-like flavin-dependent oxidoreductase (luciferase family)